MNIPQAIKQLRKERNMTQRELCKLAKISSSNFTLIENGTKSPRGSTIESIAQALNIPVAVIYITAITEDDIPENNRSNGLYGTLVAFGKDILLKGLGK